MSAVERDRDRQGGGRRADHGFRPRRLGYLALSVRDLERMVDFYREVLGLRVSDRMPYPADSPLSEGVWLRCNSDHHVLALFGLRQAPAEPADGRSPRPGIHHLAFELASFEELRAAARYVKARGLPLRGIRTGGPGCQLRLYFWDPEDNLIELYWALDQIGWDGKARPYPPIEEVDLESLDVEAWLAWKGLEFEAEPTR